ncbi:MAG: hypothetical protein R3A79_25215 [Nannocystaceae bacterium]
MWFSSFISSIDTSIHNSLGLPSGYDGLLAHSPESLDLDAPATYVLPISARSPEELDNLIWWWSNVLEDTSVSVARSCAIAALRRHPTHRAAVVAQSREGMIEGLRSLAAEKLVLWCEPKVSPSYVRLGVLHVRGKWVDWRSLYGSERFRLFAAE